MYEKSKNPASVLAREEDGTIQLTITIPKEEVGKAENQVLTELTQKANIPGFRPGKAPVEEVKKRVASQTVLEGTLSKVLPIAYQTAIKEHNLTPFISPKFELVSVKEGENWQVRVITCEAPKVEVGNYQAAIEGKKRTNSLWVPGKEDKDKKEPTPAEKENLVIEGLLESSEVLIPKPLVDEEVNHRLASLVEQTQKLGLTVEQYLTSTGKTVESLKEEYKKAAWEQLSIMLILSVVASKEGITVDEAEINQAGNGQKPTQSELNPSQKQVIGEVLKKRKTLDKLVSSL